MSVDKSESRVRGMFSQIAPRYDLLNHLLSCNVDRYWRSRTVRMLPAPADAPLLDVCTGTGDLVLAYANAANPGTPLFASDFCPEMLDIAKKKAERSKRQISFLEADTQHLPFPSDTFGLVVVAFGLRNVTDTDRGLSEMVRVCRPGGVVGVLEFSQPTFSPLGWLYQAYFRWLLPAIGQTLMRNSSGAYAYLPESVRQFPCGEKLAEKMRGAGLNQVSFRPFTLGIATLYWGTK